MTEKAFTDPFEWVQFGVDEGWVSEPACATHDGIPMLDDEVEEWQEGLDDCQFVLRIWE